MNLIHGDCLNEMKKIPDGSVDMILCDLPYGTTQNKWDSVIPFAEMWGGCNRVIKENGAIVLFSQMPFGAELINSNKRNFRYEWIWEKPSPTGFLNAKKMPMKAHENIMVFYKHLPTYNPQGLKKLEKAKHINAKNKTSSNYGKHDKDYVTEYTNYPRDIILYERDLSKVHPTQKPVPLLEYLIKTYTNEGETVLDFTMGSGSTGVACKNTNRNFIGIELDDKYFEIAKQRIENYD